MKPIIFTLTGPTCAGKSTLEKMMVEQLGFANLISETTRQPRANDVHGVNYYFNTQSEFLNKVENEELIERVEFNGEFYGLSIAEVNRVAEQGKPIVVVVEPGGRRQIQRYCKKNDISCKSLFVSADIGEIAKRFITRVLDDSQFIEQPMREKFIKSASARLEGIMTHEREWIDEKVRHNNSPVHYATPYDCFIHSFNESVTHSTLGLIGCMLKALQLSPVQ